MFVKIEAFNPLGSVKDRLALGVIEAAEKAGALKPGQTVIEATSGNTGIGLAMVCAQKGYPLVVTMAETFSVERRKLMRFLGAKVVLTPAAQRGMGMVTKAVELAKTHGWFLTRQFENEANPDMHSRTTAQEILRDFAGEPLDYWVTGYGTGGTLKGVARVLAKERPRDQDRRLRAGRRAAARQRRAAAAQPGRVGHGRPPGSFKPHPMQGWTPDFIPKLTGDAVEQRRDPPHRADRRPGRAPLQRGAGQEGGHLRRHHGRGDVRRRPAGGEGRPEGRDRPVHAARHGRALPQHAVVRRAFPPT